MQEARLRSGSPKGCGSGCGRRGADVILARQKGRAGRICNLYRLTTPAEAVAALFRAENRAGINYAAEVYPGYQGLVVTAGTLAAMTWGFPLTLKGSGGALMRPKPVTNARADKLGSPFWKGSFEHRRCLIPLDAFAEAQGPKGHKTRTWISLPGQPLFACAGIWRESEEWGPVYAMVTAEPAPATAGIHERMPVILSPDACERGAPGDALALCAPWMKPVIIDRTDEPWTRRG